MEPSVLEYAVALARAADAALSPSLSAAPQEQAAALQRLTQLHAQLCAHVDMALTVVQYILSSGDASPYAKVATLSLLEGVVETHAHTHILTVALTSEKAGLLLAHVANILFSALPALEDTRLFEGLRAKAAHCAAQLEFHVYPFAFEDVCALIQTHSSNPATADAALLLLDELCSLMLEDSRKPRPRSQVQRIRAGLQAALPSLLPHVLNHLTARAGVPSAAERAQYDVKYTRRALGVLSSLSGWADLASFVSGPILAVLFELIIESVCSASPDGVVAEERREMALRAFRVCSDIATRGLIPRSDAGLPSMLIENAARLLEVLVTASFVARGDSGSVELMLAGLEYANVVVRNMLPRALRLGPTACSGVVPLLSQLLACTSAAGSATVVLATCDSWGAVIEIANSLEDDSANAVMREYAGVVNELALRVAQAGWSGVQLYGARALATPPDTKGSGGAADQRAGPDAIPKFAPYVRVAPAITLSQIWYGRPQRWVDDPHSADDITWLTLQHHSVAHILSGGPLAGLKATEPQRIAESVDEAGDEGDPGETVDASVVHACCAAYESLVLVAASLPACGLSLYHNLATEAQSLQPTIAPALGSASIADVDGGISKLACCLAMMARVSGRPNAAVSAADAKAGVAVAASTLASLSATRSFSQNSRTAALAASCCYVVRNGAAGYFADIMQLVGNGHCVRTSTELSSTIAHIDGLLGTLFSLLDTRVSPPPACVATAAAHAAAVFAQNVYASMALRGGGARMFASLMSDNAKQLRQVIAGLSPDAQVVLVVAALEMLTRVLVGVPPAKLAATSAALCDADAAARTSSGSSLLLALADDCLGIAAELPTLVASRASNARFSVMLRAASRRAERAFGLFAAALQHGTTIVGAGAAPSQWYAVGIGVLHGSLPAVRTSLYFLAVADLSIRDLKTLCENTKHMLCSTAAMLRLLPKSESAHGRTAIWEAAAALNDGVGAVIERCRREVTGHVAAASDGCAVASMLSDVVLPGLDALRFCLLHCDALPTQERGVLLTTTTNTLEDLQALTATNDAIASDDLDTCVVALACDLYKAERRYLSPEQESSTLSARMVRLILRILARETSSPRVFKTCLVGLAFVVRGTSSIHVSDAEQLIRSLITAFRSNTRTTYRDDVLAVLWALVSTLPRGCTPVLTALGLNPASIATSADLASALNSAALVIST